MKILTSVRYRFHSGFLWFFTGHYRYKIVQNPSKIVKIRAKIKVQVSVQKRLYWKLMIRIQKSSFSCIMTCNDILRPHFCIQIIHLKFGIFLSKLFQVILHSSKSIVQPIENRSTCRPEVTTSNRKWKKNSRDSKLTIFDENTDF